MFVVLGSFVNLGFDVFCGLVWDLCIWLGDVVVICDDLSFGDCIFVCWGLCVC